jgi:hypothetical protein
MYNPHERAKKIREGIAKKREEKEYQEKQKKANKKIARERDKNAKRKST